MKNTAAIVLAAGRGTRMKSSTPKVLHRLQSRPLLSSVLEALKGAGIDRQILVLGHKDKAVKSVFPGREIVIQKKLLGSGDAVKSAKAALSAFKGEVLVICGDTPLIRRETIKKLMTEQKNSGASCTLLTAKLANPAGYGRILRDDAGNIQRIVEEKNASIYEEVIEEINVGCYSFNKKDLFSSLEKLKMDAKKKEYYLTDVIEMLAEENKKISSILCENPEEAIGINSRLDLARANAIIKGRTLEALMTEGVTVVDPNSTFVNAGARIGRDTVIEPHTIIENGVTIGENCHIGPFARIREKTKIADNVKIGNFTELVRTKVSSGSRIKHMTYLGDAEVGKNVNVGAGTITANYDGKNKNKTIIEDDSFIGVGAILIAPIKIGKGAVVGAGSVVTRNKNVPPRKTVAGVPAKVLCRRRKK